MKQYDDMEKLIRRCGDYAAEMQADMERDYKLDGSVVTEADLTVDRLMKEGIRKLFPEWTIISEESGVSGANSLPAPHPDEKLDTAGYFVVDPIDGTDVYSQGMPSWCVAAGMLDRQLNPVGAMIYAPRWPFRGSCRGMFMRLDPISADRGDDSNHGTGTLVIDGEPFSNPPVEEARPLRQIMIGSQMHSSIRLQGFKGKCRSLGSNILQLASPVIYSRIDGALSSSGYIWDIAAAHAILNWAGMVVETLTGQTFRYTESMLKGRERSGLLFAGTPSNCREMRSWLAPE